MPTVESFLDEIPNIFQDAQRSLATHRKNAAALRKIIQKNCKNEENEQLFIKEFFRNLNKILVIKKGQIAADRSLKFIVEFIKLSIKKENGNLYYYKNIYNFFKKIYEHNLMSVIKNDKCNNEKIINKIWKFINLLEKKEKKKEKKWNN